VAHQRRPPPTLDTYATLLLALAKAGAAVDRRCSAALLLDTAPQLTTAPLPSTCQLLWGVAKARVVPSGEWLRAVCGAIEARCDAMTASQLAGAVRSLAVLSEGVEDEGGERLLKATAALLAERLAGRPEGAGPGELALALWGLARLGYRVGSVGSVDDSSSGSSSSGSSSSGSVCPVAALLPHIQEQLPRLSPSQLSRCVVCVRLQSRVGALLCSAKGGGSVTLASAHLTTLPPLNTPKTTKSALGAGKAGCIRPPSHLRAAHRGGGCPDPWDEQQGAHPQRVGLGQAGPARAPHPAPRGAPQLCQRAVAPGTHPRGALPAL